MRANDELKLHFVNVNHGDATIIEFPDYGSPPAAHFAVVDFGAKVAEDRALTREYMRALVELRRDSDNNFDYEIDFVCVTHPHDDHYGGLNRFMAEFADPNQAEIDKIRNFFDCGFWTTAARYNTAMRNIIDNPNLTFVRVSAGSEFEFGQTRVTILAPSVDLRNRFDTYGVGMNDASVVLKIKYRRSYIIIAGDAEFASWGKTTEEFPRRSGINFFQDAIGLAERGERADQLACNLLRLSHHGSKHGTSLEYLERLKPRHVVIAAGSQQWYQANVSEWQSYFPHPLVTQTLSVLDTAENLNMQTYVTGVDGNLIFKYTGNWNPREVARFQDRPGSANFEAALANNLD